MEGDLARADRTVEDYVAARSEPVRAVLQALRDLVRQTVPDVTEGMKWGAPVFFDGKGEAIIYLYGGKNHAHLGFVHGAELKDPDGILKGRGPSGRYVKCTAGEEIAVSAVVSLLKQCV
ncbi:MAG: DUF1801 domain-containing protein [Alphaproteobacteria bacterium]|nr:DUF1801 domain-containing protein [Alphaproteobacteria bacterium]